MALPWLLIRIGSVGQAAPEQRGGAWYPTPEELRELRRAERRRRKREQEEAERLDATVRDVYERVAEPDVYAAKMAAARELEDEEDMLRLLVAIAQRRL